MNRTEVVAFVGKKGCGKSTTAERIIKEYEKRYDTCHRLSFAAPLKELCVRILVALYGKGDQGAKDKFAKYFFDEAWKNEVIPEIGVTGRKFIQAVGTEGCREVFGYDFWVERLVTQIESIERVDGKHLIIVDDCRFFSELSGLIRAGAYVYRLPGGQEGDAHASETELDEARLHILALDKTDPDFKWLNPVRELLD